jgi:hypothetical protein
LRTSDTPDSLIQTLTPAPSWEQKDYDDALNQVQEDDEDVVEITLEVHGGHTDYGENYYVVGNLPELGEWDATRAVRMECSQYPLWRISGLRVRPRGAKVVCEARAQSSLLVQSQKVGYLDHLSLTGHLPWKFAHIHTTPCAAPLEMSEDRGRR